MKSQPMKAWMSLGMVVALGALVASGCGRRETRVEQAIRDGILLLGNGDEIETIDPHLATGVTEHNVISSLFEGLVAEDPKTLAPVPGVAERWEVMNEGTLYRFFIRDNAKWSDDVPLTANDFVRSYQRMLSPKMASEYANMLFLVKNAQAYYEGKVTDFAEVGFRAPEERVLEVELAHSAPYFLSLLTHYSWFPVPTHVIEKFGGLEERGLPWTKDQNFVGNGPFNLKSWIINSRLEVVKSPTYWDAKTVRLNGIQFFPIGSEQDEERAFRAGQLHVTYEMPRPKIDAYRKDSPELLRVDPYLGVYFYRVNTTDPVMKDVRVRQALSLALDREAITHSVLKDGTNPAYHFTPPGTAGYTARARIETNLEKAKAKLAEAGYPNGEGFPPLEIHFNTTDRHKMIAEAIQQMWNRNLNIPVNLRNEEWKVFLDTQDQLKYQVSRSGWIGDYVDPYTFLEIWKTGDGNNDTGWSNSRYDELMESATKESNPEARMEFFQQAEAILLEELPVIPIFFYTKPFLIHPSVRNWWPTVIDHHPYKHVYLEASDK